MIINYVKENNYVVVLVRNITKKSVVYRILKLVGMVAFLKYLGCRSVSNIVTAEPVRLAIIMIGSFQLIAFNLGKVF